MMPEAEVLTALPQPLSGPQALLMVVVLMLLIVAVTDLICMDRR